MRFAVAKIRISAQITKYFGEINLRVATHQRYNPQIVGHCYLAEKQVVVNLETGGIQFIRKIFSLPL